VIEWKYFADQMLLIYGNQAEDERARHDLDSLVQTGSVREYTRRFNMLLSKMISNPLSEGDKVYLYRRGLQEKVREKVFYKPNTTEIQRDFLALTVCATACDAGLMKSKELPTGFQQPRSKRPAVGQNAAPVAKRPTFAGAVAAAAPSAAPGASRSAGAVKKGINPSFANNPISVSRFEKGECFKCGQQGHKKDNCPMAAPPSKK
jgi:hypothetical protein